VRSRLHGRPERNCLIPTTLGSPAPVNSKALSQFYRSLHDVDLKISAGTMSADGRTARDVMLGLLKTCRKLGLSFFAYLGDRLEPDGDQPRIPRPAALVRQTA
jgi:hypothetical protein